MKVFVAVVAYYYEGDTVLGVFSTREQALKVGQQRRVISHQTESGVTHTYIRGDELVVEEWEVE